MRVRLYFFMSLKKASRLIFHMLAVALVLLIAGVVVLKGMSKTEALVSVGIVGDTDDSYIDIAATMLTETETLNIIGFDSEEDALMALQRREIQGYAFLPEDFVDLAMSGKNIPLTYNVLKNPSSLSETMTKEVVAVLSPVVFNSQNSVFGMRQYLKDIDRRDLLNEQSDKMSAKYILEILQRDRLFDVETVGVADMLGLKDYYTVVIVLLYVLICTTVASPYMIKKDMALSTLLLSRGTGAIKQLFFEWLAYFCVMFGMTSVFSAVLGCGLGYGIKLLPAVMLLTAFQFLIYEMSGSRVSGLMLQFFTVIIMSYISGFFYPSYFFPPAIQKIAVVLPFGQSFSYARQLMSGTLTFSTFLLTMLGALVTVILASALRGVRMRGGK